MFEDATATFAPDAAVVVGRNNSGKTTLLSAIMTPEGRGLPKTASAYSKSAAARSAVRVHCLREFLVEEADIVELCGREGFAVLPTRPDISGEATLGMVRAGTYLVVEVVEAGVVTARVPHSSTHAIVIECENGALIPKRMINSEPAHSAKLRGLATDRLFRFDAERARHASREYRRVLGIDEKGDELITAYSQLPSERKIVFLRTVQRVLPEIRGMEAKAGAKPGQVEIRIWFTDDLRDELSFVLSEVGYGTPNVLAILFAATMDSRQRVILVDEPASYLHPGAVRELMAILAENPQHQYVFATHSFAGLEHFPRASFSLCRRVPPGDVSEIVNVGAGETAVVRQVLREVGASLSDVFAADRVIWTEGVSDADVLKIVLRDATAPRAISVLPIIHTGDFDASDIRPDKGGKRRSLAAHIYESLSKNSALIPPALAFVFDREKRNQTQLDDLKRQIEGNDATKRDRPHFFLYDEFMLENLFLDPDLVAGLLAQVAADPEHPAKPQHAISPTAVDQCWDALDKLGHFLAPKRGADPAAWRTAVHGARVLDATFEHFFGDTVEFIKAKHDPMLARLALKLDGPAAGRLRAFGRRILEAVKDPEGGA